MNEWVESRVVGSRIEHIEHSLLLLLSLSRSFVRSLHPDVRISVSLSTFLYILHTYIFHRYVYVY